jgi:SAM-dependent methyltransferase
LTPEIELDVDIETGQFRNRAVYGATLFLSAFLLFCFEPMVGKMMLPLLGGAAAVWITCLLFFQLMLLAGYGYAHVLERLAGPRAQIVTHSVMMVAVLVFLPLQFAARPDETASFHPSAWLLWHLIKSAGIPFCVVSATAPLLQNWISKTPGASGRDPYFLYAISNAGSLIALLAYPLLIEPRIGVRNQSLWWLAGYVALAVMVGVAAGIVWKRVSSDSPTEISDRSEPPSWRLRIFWLAAAFVPSGLMLAVTNHILLNLASVPFLWIVPLAAYLATFMLAFGHRIYISHRTVSRIVPVTLLLLFPFAATSRAVDTKYMPFIVAAHILILISGALLCHTALATRRPAPRFLTEFYFWIALGGVLGGAFTAVLAPSIFTNVIEYPLLVAVIAFFRETGEPAEPIGGADLILPGALGFLAIGASKLMHWASVDITADVRTTIAVDLGIIAIAYTFRHRRVRFALAVAILVVSYYRLLPQFYGGTQFVYAARNFFGIKGVKYDFATNSRRLLHGDTLHGIESMDDDLIGHPVSYYHETGPVGDVMKMLNERGSQHIGVVGLGTGSMAGWTAPYRKITFFEIDPQVFDIASSLFTFLPRCGKNCEVVMGDGRLSIAKMNSGELDLLMLDAFNSDSIPAHLVSREAIAMYLTKLKPRGLLLFHVSNRYMDVEGLISAVVTDAALEALARHDDEQQTELKARSHFIIAGKNPEALGSLEQDANWFKVKKPQSIAPWTDDYSNMLAILRWR